MNYHTIIIFLSLSWYYFVIHLFSSYLQKASLSSPVTQNLLEQDLEFPTVTRLAFEWTGRNVFVVRTNGDKDGKPSVIDVVNVDHRYHRRICSLHDVQSLLLDPHDGWGRFCGNVVKLGHVDTLFCSACGWNLWDFYIISKKRGGSKDNKNAVVSVLKSCIWFLLTLMSRFSFLNILILWQVVGLV